MFYFLHTPVRYTYVYTGTCVYRSIALHSHSGLWETVCSIWAFWTEVLCLNYFAQAQMLMCKKPNMKPYMKRTP